MGYTHYAYRPATLNARQYKHYQADVRAIITAAPAVVEWENWTVPLIIRDGLGYGQPVIEPGLVAFNGDAEYTLPDYCWGHDKADHETFMMERVLEVETWMTAFRRPRVDVDLWFTCCKTQRKPYDLIVTACLIAFAYRFPESAITSDGEWADWQAGLMLWRSVMVGHCTPDGPWLAAHQAPELVERQRRLRKAS